jgi:NAD(P)-dependent dehydrogenase (short-subunit alcohol dehydrogenase family)
MDSPTIVISGANRGIGLALTAAYASSGNTVVALCRKTSPALSALAVEVIDSVELTQTEAIDRIQTALSGRTIHCLINNAGILRDERLGDIDYDSIQTQFLVNALTPLKLSEALLPQMANPSKIAFVTSRMGSMGDNTSGGRYGHRMSKAALNAAAVSLARDLAPKNISVGILHPGLVGTDMIGGIGDITPEVAAERIIERIQALSLETSGTFFHSNGQTLPW